MSLRKLVFAVPFLAVAAFAAAPPAEVHGVQTSDMDKSIRPGDDFYAYADGGWMKKAVIPADKAAWGSFSTLAETADQNVSDLVAGLAAQKAQRVPGSNEQKIADFYSSYMDEAGIEAKGLAPLKTALDGIAAIKDKADLARALGRTLRADVDAMNNTNFYTENLFGLWVAPAFADPDHYVAYMMQGGLGLPDREYYLSDNPKMATIRTAYVAHIAKMLALAGIADAGAKADAIMALETAIAKAHVNRADSEDVLKANNPWSRADFAAKAPGLDWNAYFDGADLSKVPEITIWQPSGITGIAALVGSQPVDVWKNWLAFHLINHFAGVLPKALEEQHFAVYGATLSGTPQQAPRWKRAVAATNDSLGWAVGRLYVAKYFPPAYKATAETMVKNIVAAFGRRIDSLAWMTPETKAKAKAKLATLYVGVGYPEKWRDYNGYDVVAGDAFGNAERAESFEYHYWISRVGSVVDRSEWCMTPQTVNAVNLPMQNALNFPAAILNPPFFDANADSAFNYGAMGSIIGHEISHSFDDQGRQFDARGGLVDWWTPSDAAHFVESAGRLADQYDGYKPFPDLAVNGKQTLSENIADVAGLSVAYDAWVASLHGKPAPVIDGLTGAQRYFLAYAQSRQIAIRDAALRRQVLTDGHAPGNYRADTVRNEDAWYDAFGITPDQALYLAPDKRVRIW